MDKLRLNFSKKEANIVIHIAIGAVTAVACAMLLTVLLTMLINHEAISINTMRLCTYVVHGISVFVGTMVSLFLEKGRGAIVAGAVAASYLTLLLCANMLFFADGISGLIGGILSILVGGALSLVTYVQFTGKKKIRIKMRSR